MKEEEECTGKGRPQISVFWLLPQLYLVQQNTSHIKGSYVTGREDSAEGKGSAWTKYSVLQYLSPPDWGWELFVDTAAKSNFLCRFQHNAFITSAYPQTQTLLGLAAQLYQQQQPKDTRQIILTYLTFNFVYQRHLPTIHLRVDRLLAFIWKG